jgi:hypothetical protein
MLFAQRYKDTAQTMFRHRDTGQTTGGGVKPCPELRRAPGRLSCGRPLDPRLCIGISAAASRPALIRSQRFHSDLFFRAGGCLLQTADLRGRITSSSRSS